MRYFAYGSNMNPGRMKERGVNFTAREWAVLKGWRLEFNKVASADPRQGYANIVEGESSVVEGILYEMPDKDILKLDKKEGYPTHYDRITVTVELSNGEEVEAVTYVAQPERVAQGLKPTREYMGHLLKGCDLLSEEYCQRLRDWETLD